MRISCAVFEKPGKQNTGETLGIARERADKLQIRQVVVASTHGYTALETKKAFEGTHTKIISVSISAGFDENGWTIMDSERRRLEDSGICVLTGLHALGDDVNESFQGDVPNKIVRKVLYTFCQGMKVAVECAIMAAEAGLLDMSQDVISLAGSSEGADTAIVMKPAYARNFTKIRIKEIIAKPR